MSAPNGNKDRLRAYLAAHGPVSSLTAREELRMPKSSYDNALRELRDAGEIECAGKERRDGCGGRQFLWKLKRPFVSAEGAAVGHRMDVTGLLHAWPLPVYREGARA